MEIPESGTHILVFPYPAQGHMIPLLDLTHQLALRNLTITILVTPKNLHSLNPLLIKHPSITPLILPFPATPSIPAGVENVRDLPDGSFGVMMVALAQLYDPIVNWFKNHPSPPVAILSDMFLGWTHRLAVELGISRFVFSPSGALAMSVVYNLWRDLPVRNDPTDENEELTFSEIPNCPKYPWWKISPIYRSYVEGQDTQLHVLKDWFRGNIASSGFVINSFTELERVYLDYMKQFLGHDRVWAAGFVINSFTELERVYLDYMKQFLGQDRVWAVGPVLPPEGERVNRGGSNETLAAEIGSWLDQFEDRTVVYVCFGSQAVLTNKQMEMLALGLEKSGVRFLWSVKEPTIGHVASDYGMVPPGFKDRVAGRGFVVNKWVPQVSILNHRAVGAFLTHCGWNSVLESIVAGVPMLAWPMGADQYADADLLDQQQVGTKVCEGNKTVPDPDELARLVAESVSEKKRFQMVRAKELSKAALESIEKNGTSYNALDDFVKYVSKSR